MSSQTAIDHPFAPSAALLADLDHAGTGSEGYMGGSKWQGARERSLGKYPSSVDIARAIRADIKAAVAGGHLPGKAAGVDYRVRSSSHSGGQSVSVSVVQAGSKPTDYNVPALFTRPATEDDVRGEEWRLSVGDPLVRDDVRALGKALRAMADRYVSSDVNSQVDYFNVSCYVHVYLGHGGRML